MAFPDSFIQELIERSDIEDVVSGYVKLTKRSGSNVFGLCPFHSEKSPSFSVRPDMQTFHCFGCGKGGSVIGFIMEIENLSYPDAVRHLARRAGLRVPDNVPDEDAKKRERLLALNRDAARLFHECLNEPRGGAARAYIERRQISQKMVKRFGLGCAPDSWDTAIRAMRELGYSDGELRDSGLAVQKKDAFYDRFRNRLMFPVINVRGEVIGFSGRILGDGEPKYLNSPETAVFSKSRNLFALNLAKKTKSGYIILTEGNIDVVSLHQAGFDGAVASLGTSLTQEQARLLFRYTKQVILAYDADAAGKKAAERAIPLLEKAGLGVRVLDLGESKDPDEFIKARGPDAFRNLVERSETHIEFALAALKSKHGVDTDEGRVAFLREAIKLIAGLSGTVEREVYGMRVAETAGISAETVADEVGRARKAFASKEKKREQSELNSPAKLSQPKPRGVKYGDTLSGLAEEGLIRILCLDSAVLNGRDDLPEPEDFSSEFLGRIYGELRKRTDAGLAVSIAVLTETLDADSISHLTEILQKPENRGNIDTALTDYIDIINSGKKNREQDAMKRIYSEIERGRTILIEKRGMVDKHDG